VWRMDEAWGGVTAGTWEGPMGERWVWWRAGMRVIRWDNATASRKAVWRGWVGENGMRWVRTRGGGRM